MSCRKLSVYIHVFPAFTETGNVKF